MNVKILPAVVIAALLIAAPAALMAQPNKPQATPPPPPVARPLFLGGARKSGPLGRSATVGVLIPLKPLVQGTDHGSSFWAHRGILVEAAAGDDGLELAAGWGQRWKLRRGPALYGQDVLATAFRKRTAFGDATYVGGEAGLTMLTLRMSVGAATRVDGPAGSDRTIFTWGIGFHIGR